jgi:hypothetical protein
MSGGISISFVDFAAFSFDSDRVRCVSIRLFLVRNWCGCLTPSERTEWEIASFFELRQLQPMFVVV